MNRWVIRVKTDDGQITEHDGGPRMATVLFESQAEAIAYGASLWDVAPELIEAVLV